MAKPREKSILTPEEPLELQVELALEDYLAFMNYHHLGRPEKRKQSRKRKVIFATTFILLLFVLMVGLKQNWFAFFISSGFILLFYWVILDYLVKGNLLQQAKQMAYGSTKNPMLRPFTYRLSPSHLHVEEELSKTEISWKLLEHMEQGLNHFFSTMVRSKPSLFLTGFSTLLKLGTPLLKRFSST